MKIEFSQDTGDLTRRLKEELLPLPLPCRSRLQAAFPAWLLKTSLSSFKYVTARISLCF